MTQPPRPTIHQLDALRRIAEGRSIDQAAYDMGVSRSAVEKLLAEAKRRLSACTLAHAISIAIRAGLIGLTLWMQIGPDNYDMRRPKSTRYEMRYQRSRNNRNDGKPA